MRRNIFPSSITCTLRIKHEIYKSPPFSKGFLKNICCLNKNKSDDINIDEDYVNITNFPQGIKNLNKK